MDAITRLKRFGPAWVLATVIAFAPIEVLHWVGIIVLVAATLGIAAVCFAKYDSSRQSLSKRANVPAFGLLSVLLRAKRGQSMPGIVALPLVAAVSAAAALAAPALKFAALILFFALLVVLLWPVINELIIAAQKSIQEAAAKRAEAAGNSSVHEGTDSEV